MCHSHQSPTSFSNSGPLLQHPTMDHCLQISWMKPALRLPRCRRNREVKCRHGSWYTHGSVLRRGTRTRGSESEKNPRLCQTLDAGVHGIRTWLGAFRMQGLWFPMTAWSSATRRLLNTPELSSAWEDEFAALVASTNPNNNIEAAP